MNLKTILLDLDGVLVDFVTKAMLVHGVRLGGYQNYPLESGWDVVDACNRLRKEWRGFPPVAERDFWRNVGTHDFWATLEPFDGAMAFVGDLCNLIGQQNIVIATSATTFPESLSGKLTWIQKYMPAWDRLYMMGAPKWTMANPRSLLIDDNTHNVSAFQKHGGHTILVPRPWNSYQFTGCPYDRVLRQFRLKTEGMFSYD